MSKARPTKQKVDSDENRFINLKRTAWVLGIQTSTVLRLERAGVIPPRHVGSTPEPTWDFWVLILWVETNCPKPTRVLVKQWNYAAARRGPGRPFMKLLSRRQAAADFLEVTEHKFAQLRRRGFVRPVFRHGQVVLYSDDHLLMASLHMIANGVK